MLVQEISDISTTIPVETNVGLPIRIPVQKSSDIYYRHLSAKGRGSPLWIPEPNHFLDISYRRRGIDIGDVGIITPRGAFDFLFNICLPQDDPINAGGVPEGFSALNPPLIPAHDIQGQQELGEDTHLSSESITKDINDGGPANVTLGITFIASAREGAILTMPEGAYTVDLANTARFTQYLELNIVNWYKYATGIRGRQVKNGDLRLVVGVDKSRAWGMATSAKATHETNCPLKMRFKPKQDSSVGRIYTWDYSGMADSARSGPGRREIEELRAGDESQEIHAFENQSLFVRTLNTTLQKDGWEKLESELRGSSIRTGTDINVTPDIHYICGNPNPSDNSASASSGRSPPPHRGHNGYNAGSNSPSTGIAQISGTTSALRIHPSTFINNFLLQSKPDARIAITNDRDWISVLKQDDLSLPASDEILTRIMTTHEVSEADGVACLTPKGPLHSATVATTEPTPAVLTGGEYSTASTSFNSNASATEESRVEESNGSVPRSTQAVSFFQHSQNILINGGAFNIIQGNYVFDQSQHTTNVDSTNNNSLAISTTFWSGNSNTTNLWSRGSNAATL
ncbi:hypothetical protein BDZ97DRAFT_1842548 [Flammula alnicola]|nr:hypothetical protein BDZ97DRAFT_1842548 [Flammula alnicola]